MVDEIFNQGPKVKGAKKPTSQIRSKTLDGVLYVRADDVADALERDAPTTCASLIQKLRRK